MLLAMCCIGAYAVSNRSSDLWVMVGSWLLGYVLQRCRRPLGPFVIAHSSLGAILTKSIRSGLMSSDGTNEPLSQFPQRS